MFKWLIRQFSIFDSDVEDTPSVAELKVVENVSIETPLTRSLLFINELKKQREVFDDVLLEEVIILTTQIHNTFVDKNEIELLTLDRHHIYRTKPLLETLAKVSSNRSMEIDKSKALINTYESTIDVLKKQVIETESSSNDIKNHLMDIKDLMYVLRNIHKGYADSRIDTIKLKLIPYTHEVDDAFEVPQMEFIGGYSVDVKLFESLDKIKDIEYIGTIINGNITYDVISIDDVFFLFNILDSIIFSFDDEYNVLSEENSILNIQKKKISEFNSLLTIEKAKLKRAFTLDLDVKKILKEYIKELSSLDYFKVDDANVDIQYVNTLLKNIKLDE